MERPSLFSLLVLAATLYCLGCSGTKAGEMLPSKDASQRDARSSDSRVLALDGTTDGGVGPQDVSVADRGTGDDGVDDLGQPDTGPPPQIENCAQACQRYTACERGDIFDTDACLAACDRASRSGPPSEWFDCLESESCNLLHLCRVPSPPALTCDEVCDSVAQCGASFPFPDCREECALHDEGGAYARCGEALFGERCDAADFWACLGRDPYSDCGTRCALSVECGITEAGDCMPACITEGFDPDALRRFRSAERNQCFAFAAMSCDRAQDCLNPMIWEAVMPTMENVCEAWDSCYGARVTCATVQHTFLVFPHAIPCVIRTLRRGCPEDEEEVLRQCISRDVDLGPRCHHLCNAEHLCGSLPAENDIAGCQAECNRIEQAGTPDEQWRLQRELACSQVNTCPDLAACLAPLRAEEP